MLLRIPPVSVLKLAMLELTNIVFAVSNFDLLLDCSVVASIMLLILLLRRCIGLEGDQGVGFPFCSICGLEARPGLPPLAGPVVSPFAVFTTTLVPAKSIFLPVVSPVLVARFLSAASEALVKSRSCFFATLSFFWIL
jgi:hypothetical protein